MHYSSVSTNYHWLPHNQDPEKFPTPDRFKNMEIQPLGDVQANYEQYMKGCYDFYEKQSPDLGLRCYKLERDRIALTGRQPKTRRNYTSTGYKKIRSPDHVFKLLREFWDKNKHKRKLEQWSAGNIYTYVYNVMKTVGRCAVFRIN